jgi:uncharacterized membrane protein
MAYCPKCGAQTEGRYCQKCGSAMDPAAAPSNAGYDPALGSGTAATAGLGMDENLAAALCYIWIIGVVFLLIDPYKRNRTIRFHAFQSIFYAVACMAIWIALAIFSVTLAMMHIHIPFLGMLIWLALVAGWILMVVKAYQRDRFVMPIIGPLAEKQAGLM